MPASKMKDITGQRFGSWVVLGVTQKRIRRCAVWRCRCRCGNIGFISGASLRKGASKSCGCARVKDLEGQRFGRLLVLELISNRCGRCVVWKCLCSCGNVTYVRGTNLRQRNTKSCGCLKKEILTRSKIKNLVGQRFSRLVVVKSTHKRQGSHVVWECQCDCGVITYASTGNLSTGNKKSCGCLNNATWFSKGTNIDPMDVPFEITNLMKARTDLRKTIKQAS